MFIIIVTSPSKMYKPAIIGTITELKNPILCVPPKITSAVAAAIIRPTIIGPEVSE